MLSKNRIKQIQALQLKKNRDLEKLFIAEGKKTVLELCGSRPELIVEIFATEEFIREHEAEIRHNKLTVSALTEDDLKKISLQSTPSGILAVCRYFEEQSVQSDPEKQFSFYLDEIRDPGNFGTIIRLADWFGVATVFCSPASCDLYNPKVIQATMGAFLRVNVVYVELKDLVKTQNIKIIYGAVLNGNSVYREPLQNGLIVIGNEANGISKENLAIVNRPITIPANQNNGTESLNAAMAASILASEFFRQLKLV